jgi:hypothetical protein
MKQNQQLYDFSADKNQLLIEQRGISFEEVIMAIESGAVLDILPHPNPAKYPGQEMYVVLINDYIYIVPFVTKDADHVFLKTIFPHRKLTKQYLKGGSNEKE